MTAHQVNVEGTLNLLEFAQHEAESHGRPVVFIYPSSIAAYGLPDLDDEDARRQGAGRTTGRSRRRCTGATSCIASSSGHYYARHYKQLAAERVERQGGFPLRAIPGADFGAHDCRRAARRTTRRR